MKLRLKEKDRKLRCFYAGGLSYLINAEFLVITQKEPIKVQIKGDNQVRRGILKCVVGFRRGVRGMEGVHNFEAISCSLLRLKFSL